MQFSLPEDRFSLCSLTRSGRMMLEAMRNAPSGAAATLGCFVEVCGERDGRPCFVVFLQIIHSLALYGRRRMRVGSANWPILTHDEVALLRCIDAAVRGNDATLAVHVEWIVRRAGARDVAAYVRTLAALMGESMFGDRGEPVLAVIGEGGSRSIARERAGGRPAP